MRAYIPRTLQTTPALLSKRRLEEREVPWKTSRAGYRGGALSARGHLTHPANAVPRRVTKCTATVTGVTYKPKTQAVPITRMGVQGIITGTIRAVLTPAIGKETCQALPLNL